MTLKQLKRALQFADRVFGWVGIRSYDGVYLQIPKRSVLDFLKEAKEEDIFVAILQDQDLYLGGVEGVGS